MNKQKGLAPLLIVLLIALAVGEYLITKQTKPVIVSQSVTRSSPSPVSSSSAETANPDSIRANWKTYNDWYANRFSFKHSDNWFLHSEVVMTEDKFLTSCKDQQGRNKEHMEV
ncbi:hypothetical protein HYU93_04925 [Candidatus Daviesbacteria bacterium]|nr:hypothetical protein [Candidatus Daviesbacteria bacterium]